MRRIHVVKTFILKPQHSLFAGPTQQLPSLACYLQTLCWGLIPDPLGVRGWGTWDNECLGVTHPWNEARWDCRVPVFHYLLLGRAGAGSGSHPFQLCHIFPSLLPTGSLGKSWNPEQMGLSHLHAFGPTMFTPSSLSTFPTPIQPKNLADFLSPCRSLFWIFPLSI